MMKHLGYLFAFAVLFATFACFAGTPMVFTCGDTLIYPIRECDNVFSRQIFPQDKATQELLDATYNAQSVPGTTSSFLLYRDKKWILIDTGISGKGCAVLVTLEQLHVSPMQIETVIITHNHSDHTGNLMDNFGRARFPRAMVYLPIDEVKGKHQNSTDADARIKRISKGYLKRNRTYRDGQEIVPGLKAMAAPGHTAGHMVLLLDDKALFIADLIHAALWQFPNPELCTAYDADPKTAIETRIKFLTEAAENDWVILGAHLPYPCAGTLKAVQGGQKPAFQYFTLKENEI